jgi:hypothetical protein
VKLRPVTAIGMHPTIHIAASIDRHRDGRILAMVHCLSNEPRVTYSDKHAVDLDGVTFSELTRAIRSAMGQIRTLSCTVCGRIAQL